MKVEFINPFIVAALEVLESVIKQRPEQGPPALRSAVLTTQQLSIAMAVTGAVEGQTLYGMSLVTANRIAAAMSGSTEMSFTEQAGDSIIELGNKISSQAAALLTQSGYECQIAPPTLMKGRDLEVCASATGLIVPLYSDFGKIEINVALKGNDTADTASLESQPPVEPEPVAAAAAESS